MSPATAKSPSESSLGSPRRALSALGPASPSKKFSDLASPGEIRRLLEAKGSAACFSPQHSISHTDTSSTQLLARPISALGEHHELAETKTAVRSTGSKVSLTEKGSDLKLPSGPLSSSQTSTSEKKPRGGSSLLVLTSTDHMPARKSSGRGLAELDKTKSSSTAFTQGAEAKTGTDRQELGMRASTELLAAGSTARQLEISSLPFSGRAQKSGPTSPETDAKGSPQRKKDKKSHKGLKVLKGSMAPTDDENLSISEHIAQAISESSADFADIPLQVNMTIDLVPPKSTGPMSPPRSIMSPVHIEKKMIVESCKDGHVEVKVPPVYIDSPDGRCVVDEALNVSISVDVGKQASQGRRSPEEESHQPDENHHPEEGHHHEKQ